MSRSQYVYIKKPKLVSFYFQYFSNNLFQLGYIKKKWLYESKIWIQYLNVFKENSQYPMQRIKKKI